MVKCCYVCMSFCVKPFVLLLKSCSIYMKYNLKLGLWPESHPEHWLWARPDDNHLLNEATHHHLLFPIKYVVLLLVSTVAAGIWSRRSLIGLSRWAFRLTDGSANWTSWIVFLSHWYLTNQTSHCLWSGAPYSAAEQVQISAELSLTPVYVVCF